MIFMPIIEIFIVRRCLWLSIWTWSYIIPL